MWRSLRLRLTLGALTTIVASLALAGIALGWLFERHAERTLSDDLDVHLAQLIAGLRRTADGEVELSRVPVDPRFGEPLSGLYWQVSTRKVMLRSRSLWDQGLALDPDTPEPGHIHRHRIGGPGGQRLMVVERLVSISPSGSEPVRVAVGIDFARVEQARNGFLMDLVPALAVLAAVLGALSYLQVRLGLGPLRDLRARVAELRSRRGERLDVEGPTEVAPLVDEINALLEARELAIRRARQRAADLAHGLKTPLTALEGDARRLRSLGHVQMAQDIAQTATDMRRHVERELVRARLLAGTTREMTDPGAVVAALAVTLRRTPDGERVDIDVDGAGVELPVAREDLMECLGSLLENGVRHARSRLQVRWANQGDRWVIEIDDDGPGIAPDDRERLVQRGGRRDETGTGAGLGLAIASDILEAYGAMLELRDSPLGGLGLTLSGPLQGLRSPSSAGFRW